MKDQESINEIWLGLDENKYNSLNYKDYLTHERFHHSEKGCEVEIIASKREGNYAVLKFCKTHNVLCSKTGWESGWYQGEETAKTDQIISHCIVCGKEIILKNKVRYTSYCSKECKDYNRIKRINDRLDTLPKKCQICGEPIIQKKNCVRKYCDKCGIEKRKEQCQNIRNKKKGVNTCG